MAADDLVYVEKDGQAIPRYEEVQKVFVSGGNVLVGSSGVVLHPETEYKHDDWISTLIKSDAALPLNHPSDIAERIKDKARSTFKAEDVAKGGAWETYRPGERFVSYAVAGYGRSFHRPYVFEVGAEVNPDRNGLKFSLTQRREHNLRLGEDAFLIRAWRGIEPQNSMWRGKMAEVTGTIGEIWSDLPTGLQEVVASIVASIKIEAHFNPQKVGGRVRVGVIPRDRSGPRIDWI
jgi:hypothetical protein